MRSNKDARAGQKGLDDFFSGRPLAAEKCALPVSRAQLKTSSNENTYVPEPTYLLGRLVGHDGTHDKHNLRRKGIPDRPQEESQEEVEGHFHGWSGAGGQARLDQWPTSNAEAPGMREHPRSREVDMDKMPTPRTPIVESGISVFRAAFEYATDDSGMFRPVITSGSTDDLEDEVVPQPMEMPLVQPSFSISMVPNHDFFNPTDAFPMKGAKFLSYLDLNAIVPLISEKYANNDRHYRHDPQAMFKALILRRLRGIRWHTDLERYFQGQPDEAKMLGFTNPNGRRTIPNHCTFSHFERRLGIDGMREIFDILVMQIRTELKRMGMSLGTNVAIDSTPIEGKKNDPDTSFNPYYRRKGYKIHGVYDLDFQLPIALEFTKITDGDAPHLPSLLDKLHVLGMDPKEVWADGAYASYDNLAFVATNCKGKAHFNFKSDAKENKMGSVTAITRLYKTLWKHEGYDPNPTMEKMLEFLMNKGYREEVGAYYWNIYVRDWRDRRDSTKQKYNRRAAIEAFHGHMKQQMLLEKFMDARGIERAERHVLMTYISLLSVALCRLQHGICDGLSTVKCFN